MLRTRIDIAEVTVGERRVDIRRMLLERRRELLNEIQSKVRDVREVGSNNHHYSADLRETVEADPEDDLVFALIQMRAETLERVNETVRHCEQGTYGYCVDCGDVIALLRLRALPFAVRCRDCEETREDEQRQERVRLQRVNQGRGAREP
jgi:DnaK suppressor protein